jgi:alginate O-acetyltransferase complex protein AlgI
VRTQLNIWIVFFLYGLWHGAGWNFFLWGILHGFFLSLERMGFDRVLQRLWRPFRHLYLVLVVMSAFVFFRTETLSGALSYFLAMLGLAGGDPGNAVVSRVLNDEKLILIIIGIAATLPWRSMSEAIKERLFSSLPNFVSGLQKFDPWLKASARTAQLISLMVVFFISLMYIAAGNNSPFIYFRF